MLPNPSMVFTPFDQLPASDLNDIVENIEALSDGTGLSTNAVTAAKLATNAITLGFASTTGNTVGGTGVAIQVAGLTSSVTIPSGGRRVRINVYLPGVYNDSIANTTVYIYDGSVPGGTLLNRGTHTSSAANHSSALLVSHIFTPSPGAKTFNVGINTTAGSGGIIVGAIGGTAYIHVESI